MSNFYQHHKREEKPMDAFFDLYLKELTKSSNLKLLSTDLIVKFADQAGREFSRIPLSQIRKFFNTVKKMSLAEKFNINDVMLLKPIVAYTYSRNKNNNNSKAFDRFKNLMDICLDRIKDEADFKRFLTLFESILAYHKFYGGRE